MKKDKCMAWVFAALAVLLSDMMCAVVAYVYCDLLWGGRYGGYSAPPEVAFVNVIPYGAGILVCAALALYFRRRASRAA